MPNRKSKRGAPSRAEVYTQLAVGLGKTATALEKNTSRYLEAELKKIHRMIWLVLAVALYGVHWALGSSYLLFWIGREGILKLKQYRENHGRGRETDRTPTPPGS